VLRGPDLSAKYRYELHYLALTGMLEFLRYETSPVWRLLACNLGTIAEFIR
jgi:hypothetical protein